MRKGARARGRHFASLNRYISVCVCVCVRERERERYKIQIWLAKVRCIHTVVLRRARVWAIHTYAPLVSCMCSLRNLNSNREIIPTLLLIFPRLEFLFGIGPTLCNLQIAQKSIIHRVDPLCIRGLVRKLRRSGELYLLQLNIVGTTRRECWWFRRVMYQHSNVYL